MSLSPERWKEISPSQFAWEREALDFIRAGLPDCEPYRAWSNFEFVAADGTINEVDVLVFTPRGFFLLEIKGRPGVLSGDSHTWRWRYDRGERVMDNPLFLANRKAKKLKSLLESKPALRDVRLPFLDALVFCSDSGLQCQLQGEARQRVCLRDLPADGAKLARAGILAALRRREASGLIPNPPGRFDAPTARALSRAMDQAGIRPSQRTRRVGDYKLNSLLFENGRDAYQDWEAEHFQVPTIKKLVRLYLTTASGSSGEKESMRRAARREYEILETLRHPTILLVQQLTEHEFGPALIFEYQPGAVRLDHYLTQFTHFLNISTRLEIVRQLAEALKFAHDKHAHHRGLCPQSVLVFSPESAKPQLKIYNWQTGQLSSSTTGGSTRISPTVHPDLFWEDRSLAYVAPEVINDPTLRGEYVDVFSLGALAYHIFSGQVPASSAVELAEKLRRDRGLRLSAVMDGAGEELQLLVESATHPEVTARFASVDEFLEQLRRVEDELTTPAAGAITNPTVAKAGDRLVGNFLVKERFNSGSAAVTFLVEHEAKEIVLKIANSPENNSRILEEFEILQNLRHQNIVAVYNKVQVGNLWGFTMQRSGEKTLAQRLRSEGRLSLELLERAGEELLQAMVFLDEKGVFHRDIKPENLGLGSIGKGKVRLVLFDFSLSRTPVDNIRAGTPGYLEPFLAERRRWDTHAERYAAAVTLYAMATGAQPRWGDGMSDPAQLSCEVTLDAERFDAPIREGLLKFFRQALRRDYRKRFDNAEEMLRDWRRVFENLDKISPITSLDSEIDLQSTVAKAKLETKVAELGLSGRSMAAIDRLGATTVRDLLQVPLRRIYRLPGSKIRKEVVELTNLLRGRTDLSQGMPSGKDAALLGELGDIAETSVDALAQEAFSFLKRRSHSEKQVLQFLLGWEGEKPVPDYQWPSGAEVATRANLSRAFVEECLHHSYEHWSRVPEITALREDLQKILRTNQGVMTVQALSLAVLASRGSAEQEPWPSRLASSVTRAGLETEASTTKPRFLIYRRGLSVLVAETEELADYAARLGEKADELAQLDPLHNSSRVVETLRSVPLPTNTTPFSEAILVKLAAAASKSAAVSSKFELYPRQMAAGRALKLAQGALAGGRELTVEQIRQRVRARYPEASPLPDRPALDELLLENGLDLVWHPDLAGGTGAYRFREYDEASLSTGTLVPERMTTAADDKPPAGPTTEEIAEARVFENKLKRADQDGAFLVLAVPPQWMRLAEQELLSRFAVRRINCDELMLSALKATAADPEVQVDWSVVLSADAAPPKSEDWQNLMVLVERALPKVEQALFTCEKTILLVNPGLLARYQQMEVLDRLRDRIGRVGSTLHGLWVLVPTDGQTSPPTLNGRPVPVFSLAQWSRINEAWLTNKHRA
jgi:serine/threonine protein kinase